MVLKKFIAQNMPTMLIEIEERHSGIQPHTAINEIEQLGYKCFFIDENFTKTPKTYKTITLFLFQTKKLTYRIGLIVYSLIYESFKTRSIFMDDV